MSSIKRPYLRGKQTQILGEMTKFKIFKEKIFEKVYRDDGRQVMAIAHTGELKIAV
jgi:hypothetical protein